MDEHTMMDLSLAGQGKPPADPARPRQRAWARLRRWAICAGVALMLAACSDAPPTPVATTSTATAAATAIPTATAAPVAATASVAFPLVPAFPTSTVAFSGAGPLAASMPFSLSGGSYHVSWNTRPIGPGLAPTWMLVGSIHATSNPGTALPLVNVSVPAGSPQDGVVAIDNIPAGTYVLTVAAAPACSWTISIHP